MTEDKIKKLARRYSLIYAILAIIWVIVSGLVMLYVSKTTRSWSVMDSVKDILFVVVTTCILYAVLKVTIVLGQSGRPGGESNQRLLTSQAEVLEQVASGAPLKEALENLLLFAEKEFPGVMASVHLVDEANNLRHGAALGLAEAFVKAADGTPIGNKSGASGAAAASKRAVISTNVATDPIWETHRGLMAQHDLRACWAFPILDSEQNVIGTLAFYFRKAASPDESQTKLIKSITHIAAIAISRHRAEKIRLESEQRYRILTDQAADAFFVQDQNGMFLEVNRRACEYLGYSREELLQMQAVDIEKDFDSKGWLDLLRSLRPGQIKTVIGQHQRKDGTRFPVEIRLGSFVKDAKVIYHALSRDITDRKRAADALEMFRTLVDRVNDSIEVIDPESGRFLDINEKACTDLGYTREEMLSLSVLDVDPTQDAAGFKALREKLWDTGALMAESVYRRKDGTTFPVEINMKWVWLDRDYVVAVVRDITERKKTEAALRESEYQFADLVNNIDGIVWEADPATHAATFISFQALRILGYPSEEWISSKAFWLDHLHPDDRESALKQYGLCKQSGQARDFEYRMIASDGRIVWIHDFVSVLLEDGKVARMRGVMVDVTERKTAEAEVRKRDARFRLMIENASDIVTVLNKQGIVSFQSPAATRIMGYRAEDMATQNGFELIHPEDLARFKSTLANAIAHPGLPVSIEYRYKHGDGNWRFMQTVARSVEGESADGFIVANSRDITETRRLEEQFRQSQKMEAIGQLAGGVAHDLNNILTVVHMQSDLLKYGDPLTPMQSESVLDIEKASRRAADLTRQLLMFSRRQAAMKHDLDLNAVVTNITKMLQRILGEDVAMHISYAAQPLPVHADSGMLDQILLNLAVNSRDAMPAGGKIVIETSVAELDEFAASQKPNARVGRFACLSVSDNGKGIPPEVLPRIFEPFFTTKDIGKGTGLGLATVFGIVQQHNGWINAYSEVGKGTTFRVYLPLQKEAEEVAAENTVVAQGGNETILLVEDEQSLRVLVRNVLTRLGYRVLEATTGLTAVEVWKEHRNDIKLVLTDLVMPDGMTGKQLGDVLTAENPNLRVIYTSGYSRDITGQGSNFQDGVNFLSKPFQASKLAQTVRNSLDSASASNG
jgi:PAS domain S-box-containing protein